MSQLVYVKRATQTPLTSASGGEFDFGDFFAGEERTFGLRFIKDGPDGGVIEEDPDIRFLQVSLGLVDARSEGGDLAYQIGDGPSTAANTTADLPHNATAEKLAAAINAVPALVAIYGTAKVELVPGGYTIYLPNAVGKVNIRARRNRVYPVSVLRTWAYQIDGVWVHEVRLQQAQLDATTDWIRVLPQKPTIVPVRDGGVDSSNTVKTTEVQRINFSPEYRGTYQIRRPDTGARTSFLSIADGPEQVQPAVQAIYGSEGTIKVTNPGDSYGEIEFAGALAGVDVPLLEVIPGTAPAGDPTFTVSLKRPGAYIALRARDGVSVYLEVKAKIAEPGAAVDDPGKPTVLFRREVTLRRDQNFDETLTVTPPPWLRSPNPKDYVIATDDQLAVGEAHWAGPIGNGEDATITIVHNLASEAILPPTFRENISGGRVLVAGTDYETRVMDANSLQVTFTEIPSAGGIYAAILAAVPVTAWLPHTHTTAQIVGLDDTLDALLGRVVSLEGKYASVGVPASSGSTTALVTVFPARGELISYRGTEAAFDADKGLDLTKVPTTKAPLLLPAVHNASVDVLPTPLPSPTGNAGKVWQNQTGADVTISSGGKLRSVIVPNGGYVACDGNVLFGATRGGTTTSYYPTSFEKPVWVMPVNSAMFAVNRILDIPFGLRLQTVRATCGMQWVLIVEVGIPQAQTTPSPIGLNLSTIAWAAAPVFSQKILVLDVPQEHYFGVRLQRDLASIKLDQTIYGVTSGNNAAAPTGPDFVLRAKLGQADTENNTAGDRGWVFYQLIGSVTRADDGTTKVKPAQATIS